MSDLVRYVYIEQARIGIHSDDDMSFLILSVFGVKEGGSNLKGKILAFYFYPKKTIFQSTCFNKQMDSRYTVETRNQTQGNATVLHKMRNLWINHLRISHPRTTI